MPALLLFLLLPLSKSFKCGGDHSEEEEIPAHKRHLQTRSSTLSPIRVHFYKYNFDLGNSTENTYFDEEIIPAVSSFLSTSLEVYQLTKNLILSSTKCLSYVIIPTEHKTTGVEADLIIYLTVNNLTDVSYVAFAGTCERESEGLNNVLAGTVVINIPNFLGKTFTYQFTTLTHEITHILGFSRSSYKYWKNSKGLKYEDNTLTKNSTIRGLTNFLIVTPNVVKKAKEAFNCTEIEGIELEEYGGDGSANSHWDRRILINDYMTASVASDAIWSTITLALLQDTGWYTVNYDLAVAPVFGKDQGCDFFNKPCLEDGKSLDSKLWCDTNTKYTCDPFALNKARCKLQNYTSDLPDYFQYFSSPILGGSDEYSDYCPYGDGYSNGACRGNSKTTSILKKTSEVISINSRCFESNLYQSPKTLSAPYAACYEVTECSSTEASVKIGNQLIKCPFTGATFSVSGYTGTITCPASNILCEDVPCKELCRGRGTCSQGLCSCFSGFGGESCSVVCEIGCLSCNSTYCFECDQGFTMVDGSCSECISGCKECENKESCDLCSEKFYLNNGTCLECGESCLECEDLENCVECENGMFLSGGVCFSCGYGCQECLANGTCIQCEDGYKVEDGDCLSYCLGGVCVECDTGYYLTDLYQCVECDGGYCEADLKRLLLGVILISFS